MKYAEVILYRFKTSNQGTIGLWLDPLLDTTIYSLELPWYNNRNNISCIPHGKYICEIVKSPKFGKVYHIKNVPSRQHILIHPANLAGATSFGYKTHLQGCIALGLKYGKLYKQDAIFSSKPAINKLMTLHENKPFTLRIIGV